MIINKEGEYEIVRFPNGTIQWAFANSNPGWNFINTGYVAPLNQWTHVAVTYDNGTIKTYANGNLVHTYNGSGSIGDVFSSQNDFRTGGRQFISQHFQGRIDEVRAYNRALTPGEVSTLPSAGSSAITELNWLVADQLGTPRMIFDKTGSLASTKRHDYLPFGEELYAGQGGRTAALGYAGDTIRQKFTRKERDNETGLDYFGARYYASTQGRFTSPDEFRGGPDELYAFADDAADNPTFYADLTNPHSLNKYQYTYNNPLNMVDPDGHCPDCPPYMGGPANCVKSIRRRKVRRVSRIKKSDADIVRNVRSISLITRSISAEAVSVADRQIVCASGDCGVGWNDKPDCAPGRSNGPAAGAIRSANRERYIGVVVKFDKLIIDTARAAETKLADDDACRHEYGFSLTISGSAITPVSHPSNRIWIFEPPHGVLECRSIRSIR